MLPDENDQPAPDTTTDPRELAPTSPVAGATPQPIDGIPPDVRAKMDADRAAAEARAADEANKPGIPEPSKELIAGLFVALRDELASDLIGDATAIHNVLEHAARLIARATIEGRPEVRGEIVAAVRTRAEAMRVKTRNSWATRAHIAIGVALKISSTMTTQLALAAATKLLKG